MKTKNQKTDNWTKNTRNILSKSKNTHKQKMEQTVGAKPTVKAVALISGDTNVRGSLHFVQGPNGVTHVKGKITGLKPGLHGFHIHALGDTTNGCNSTDHGSYVLGGFDLVDKLRPVFDDLRIMELPVITRRHAGDLGNIIAGTDGVAEVSIADRQIPLSGQHSILGRAVVVHADPDDLGQGNFNYLEIACRVHLVIELLLNWKSSNMAWCELPSGTGVFTWFGGHELSKTTGNAGARVGCVGKTRVPAQVKDMMQQCGLWRYHRTSVLCLESLLAGCCGQNTFICVILKLIDFHEISC
ncbi:hypothetical protein Patl1_22919 [Pistacia atlantica]|uniref:Uncharacterized protein n=1 Tax=Pistacia atlantica TaxID=434234 RepID=A0ACC0ZZM5_9ROSI|nr:hypothetical protein Patl1_22919 [Pistacia atlantica]